MNANTKLILAGALLAFALVFYFLGEGLLGTAEAPIDVSPTPTTFQQVLQPIAA